MLFQSQTRWYGYTSIHLDSNSNSINEEQFQYQKNEFLKLNVLEENIRIEVIKNYQRPVFKRLIEEELPKDSVLFVPSIYQCCENILEFCQLHAKLYKKSILLNSLDLPYFNELQTQASISAALSYLANFESECQKERIYQNEIRIKKLLKNENEDNFEI